jgi:HTH-type transcriptional regulator/antitoxin HigA
MVMDLRMISNELQYTALLDEAKELALADPPKGSKEADRLEIIALLLDKYETSRFLLNRPDPVDAIVYRLAEMGLKQKDLADIMGSKSRASELLSRKRALTVEMIRVLHERLRIPADILVGPMRMSDQSQQEIEWSKFPAKEMQRRGWFAEESAPGQTGEALVKAFFSRISVSTNPVLLRRTLVGDTEGSDKYALYAWIARVLIRARDIKRPDTRYSSGSVTDEFLRQLAKLSHSDQGPLLAKEFLAMKGIVLVVEPHLPKTRLDGAAMLDEDGTPVIGLTLRYDRIDNFWFTLMHELVHVQRHLGKHGQAFVDELDATKPADAIETEADLAAAEAFIPRSMWKSSDAYRLKRADAVMQLASELVIHPAIIAGRIRRETGNYRLLKEFVGQGKVQHLFPEIKWSKESHE